jgi:hypothetical protein
MLLAEDLVSDTPTHNAANYGVPAYPLQYMFRKPSRNDDELYGLYRRQGNVYVFKRAKNQEWELFFFQVGESIIRNIIFLIKYKKTRYLLASFLLYA